MFIQNLFNSQKPQFPEPHPLTLDIMEKPQMFSRYQKEFVQSYAVVGDIQVETCPTEDTFAWVVVRRLRHIKGHVIKNNTSCL